MFDKERKIIRKLDEQTENNKYVLYLTAKEYKAYKKLLEDLKDIFAKDLPQVWEQHTSYSTWSADTSIAVPAPTYKAHPVKVRP